MIGKVITKLLQRFRKNGPCLRGPYGDRVKVGHRELVIGRGQGADFNLKMKRVSRRHAAVRLRDGLVYVCDFGSASGTFINGVKLPENGEWVLLPPDGQLNVGGYPLILERLP